MLLVLLTTSFYYTYLGVLSLGGILKYRCESALATITNPVDVMQMLDGLAYLYLGTLVILIASRPGWRIGC